MTTPLPILCSCRVRLTETQRDTLKQAHNKLRYDYAFQPSKPVLKGSTIAVETKAEAPAEVYKKFGMSPIVVSDLIGTRDSISLPVLVKLQALLDVQVVTKAELKKAFDGYLRAVVDGETL